MYTETILLPIWCLRRSPPHRDSLSCSDVRVRSLSMCSLSLLLLFHSLPLRPDRTIRDAVEVEGCFHPTRRHRRHRRPPSPPAPPPPAPAAPADAAAFAPAVTPAAPAATAACAADDAHAAA